MELLLSRSEPDGSRLRRSVRILVAQQNSKSLERAYRGRQSRPRGERGFPSRPQTEAPTGKSNEGPVARRRGVRRIRR